MNPTNQDKLKAGIFCESPKAILNLLQSIFFVIPIEQARFSQEDAIDLDIIFIDEKQVDWSVVQALSDKMPIVFLAENKTLAYEALKHGVVDMILAPYGKKEMEVAVSKAIEFLKREYLCGIVKMGKNGKYPSIKGLSFQFKSIKLNVLAVDFRKIRLFRADGNVTHILLDKERKEIGNFPISHCEPLIKKLGFIRVHRKYIVNLAFIDKVVDAGNGKKSIVIKSHEIKIPIARRRWKDFAEAYS